MRLGLPVLFYCLCVTSANAGPLTVAVASNFRSAAQQVVAAYTARTGQDVRISSASTGKLYAQIRNGAPYDVFLAADSKHPRLLEEAALTVDGSRATYAVGRLVLWSRDVMDCRQALENLGKRRLAIANPGTAPYGIAARQFLVSANLWERVEPRLVLGENVGQAMQFVATRNAQLGLVAASQAADSHAPQASCSWPVPPGSYDPIEQQLVILRRARMHPAVSSFVEFLSADTAREIVAKFGYGLPQ